MWKFIEDDVSDSVEIQTISESCGGLSNLSILWQQITNTLDLGRRPLEPAEWTWLIDLEIVDTKIKLVYNKCNQSCVS